VIFRRGRVQRQGADSHESDLLLGNQILHVSYPVCTHLSPLSYGLRRLVGRREDSENLFEAIMSKRLWLSQKRVVRVKTVTWHEVHNQAENALQENTRKRRIRIQLKEEVHAEVETFHWRWYRDDNDWGAIFNWMIGKIWKCRSKCSTTTSITISRSADDPGSPDSRCIQVRPSDSIPVITFTAPDSIPATQRWSDNEFSAADLQPFKERLSSRESFC
jgi:hypothetical protein